MWLKIKNIFNKIYAKKKIIMAALFVILTIFQLGRWYQAKDIAILLNRTFQMSFKMDNQEYWYDVLVINQSKLSLDEESGFIELDLRSIGRNFRGDIAKIYIKPANVQIFKFFDLISYKDIADSRDVIPGQEEEVNERQHPRLRDCHSPENITKEYLYKERTYRREYRNGSIFQYEVDKNGILIEKSKKWIIKNPCK